MPDWNIVDDDPDPDVGPIGGDPDAGAADRDDADASPRLDAARIRVVMLDRRAAHRARQWAFGGAAACGVAAAVVVERAVAWRGITGDTRAVVVAFACAGVLVVGGGWLVRRALVSFRRK